MKVTAIFTVSFLN